MVRSREMPELAFVKIITKKPKLLGELQAND